MIRLIGLKKFNKKLERVEKVTNEFVEEELRAYGEKVQVRAKTNHRYTSRSGALNRSIKRRYSYSASKKSHRVKVYLDSRMTTVSGGGSYGVFQHEGTKYIRKDRFLTRAAKAEYQKLRRRLRRIPKRVKRAL